MALVLEPSLGELWDDSVAKYDNGAVVPHVAYQRDPIRWAVEKLGVNEQSLVWSLNGGYKNHEWDGTPDPLAAAFRAIADWQDVGIESGTGTGKSYGVAVLILWFLACFENAEVYTFAPTEQQLKLYIWKYITQLWPRFVALFPTAALTDLTLRMRGGLDEGWAAHGYPVGIRAGEQVSVKASGMHAQHMLLVYEEMTGIPAPVVEAGSNTCTAPHNIRIGLGNPLHQLDALHLFCQSPGVVAVRMSSLDHPNIVTQNPDLVSGAISQKSIDKRRAEYGEDDPIYQSRVRGISPEQASDALIRLDWLKRSAARHAARLADNTIPTRVSGKGVDVANSEHGDRAAICDFAENVVVRLDAFACPDANKLGTKVVFELLAADMDPLRVGIDGIGVGAGTVNECRRLKQHVRALYASESPIQMMERGPDGKPVEWSPDVNQFRNLRSQMYWQLREDLRLDRIDIAEDLELWQELTTPTFVDDPKTIVEPKAEIKARLGRSPDKADALVMANWVRERRPYIAPPKVIKSAWNDTLLEKEAEKFRRVEQSPMTHQPPEQQGIYLGDL